MFHEFFDWKGKNHFSNYMTINKSQKSHYEFFLILTSMHYSAPLPFQYLLFVWKGNGLQL